MEFTITKEQIECLIKMAEHGSTNVIKADLKNWFPKAFEKELIVGKWYKHRIHEYIFCFNGQYEDKSQYGFSPYGEWRTDASSAKRHLCHLDLATEEEVESALIAEAKRRGYKKGVTCLFGFAKVKRTISTNKIKWDTNYIGEGHLSMGTDIIFKDGRWNEIIPTEKTVIPHEKALKIIAKKLKVSPENIEIK